MGDRDYRNWLRVVAAGLAVAALLVLPSPAAGGALKRLATAACPAPYEVVKERSYSAKRVRKARHGRFKVHKRYLRLVPPVDWRRDPYRSLAFRGELHDFGWINVLFYAYRSGDRSALAQARSLLLDWARAARKGLLGSRAWFDKVVGDRAPYLAYGLRAMRCEGMLDREQARLLLHLATGHGKFLVRHRHYTQTNRGLSMDLGLVLLQRSLPFLRGASHWRRIGIQRFARTLRRRLVEEEGFWLEHSTSYQFLVQRLVARLLAVPGFADPALHALHERMQEVAGWLVQPDGNVLLLGNTNFLPVGDEIVSRAADDEGLFVLPRSGLAFVKRRQPPAYLSLAATFHGATHKHADELSFDLYEQGHRIVSDSGLFDKDPGRWYRFSRSAAAHSALTVDREGLPIDRGKLAYGSGILATGEGDGWYALQGRNPLLLRQKVSHHRLLLYKPGFALLVVDSVRARRAHTYRRRFQLGPDIDLIRGPEQLLLSAPGFTASLSSDSSVGEGKLRLARGWKSPPRGFVFPRFRLAVPRWTVTYNTRGQNVDHIAAFGLRLQDQLRAELVGETTPEAATVKLSTHGIPLYTVAVSRSGAQLSVEQTP